MPEPEAGELTPTAYAVLGLLARRPMSAYEIAKEARTSLHHFWPRAERRIYDEPKRLASVGYVSGREEKRSGRWRTVYTISAPGRRALAEWFDRPCSPPQFESEAVLKVSLGDLAQPEQLTQALGELRAQSEARMAEGLDLARTFLEMGDEPSARMHAVGLMFAFVFDQAQHTARWAEWAEARISRWAGTRPDRRGPATRKIFRDILAGREPF